MVFSAQQHVAYIHNTLYAIVRLSVRPSLSQKRLKLELGNFPIPLVFLGKFHQAFLKGSPEQGHQTRDKCKKQAIFQL